MYKRKYAGSFGGLHIFAVAREIIALLVSFHTIAVTRKGIFSILCE